jgi:hypothetical protein
VSDQSECEWARRLRCPRTERPLCCRLRKAAHTTRMDDSVFLAKQICLQRECISCPGTSMPSTVQWVERDCLPSGEKISHTGPPNPCQTPHSASHWPMPWELVVQGGGWLPRGAQDVYTHNYPAPESSSNQPKLPVQIQSPDPSSLLRNSHPFPPFPASNQRGAVA